MKLKVRYENEFQTIELDAKSMDEMWVSLSLEDGENLTQEEKEKLCEISLEVLPDFIKTSTGFGTGGATVQDVALMKDLVGGKIKIKAAGGIRTAEQALAMIAAGASRIGTSRGCEIIEQYKTILQEGK